MNFPHLSHPYKHGAVFSQEGIVWLCVVRAFHMTLEGRTALLGIFPAADPALIVVTKGSIRIKEHCRTSRQWHPRGKQTLLFAIGKIPSWVRGALKIDIAGEMR